MSPAARECRFALLALAEPRAGLAVRLRAFQDLAAALDAGAALEPVAGRRLRRALDRALLALGRTGLQTLEEVSRLCQG